ncbi:MAG: hypothetical protein WAT39_18930 [Planctomycetota bacterium]
MTLDDTHPAARAVQDAILHAMTPAQRFAMVEELTDATIRWSRDALRAQMPGAPESAVILRWIELVYGAELAARVTPFAPRLGLAPA